MLASLTSQLPGALRRHVHVSPVCPHLHVVQAIYVDVLRVCPHLHVVQAIYAHMPCVNKIV